jgi:hypothetical protein
VSASEPNESGNKAAFITDVFSFRSGYRRKVDLDGVWEFRRDKEDAGKSLGWQEGKDQFADTIKIPGVPQAQGIGDPDSRQKHEFFEPFWVRRTFIAPVFRELSEATRNGVPETQPTQDNRVGFGNSAALSSRNTNKRSQRVWLRIGGIFPAAELYLNGQYVGYTRSSRTQQRVDVTPFLKPGEANLIAIKVCDLPSVRLDGMFEWRELSMVWSGVYRSIEMEITDAVCVVDVFAQPRLASKSVHVTAELSQAPSEPVTIDLDVRDGDDHLGSASVEVPAGQTNLEADVTLSHFTEWSPGHPKLYILDVTVHAGATLDKVAIRFGMREIFTTKNKFYLNGKPLYVRCFGDMQLYMDTIAPPPDKDWYLSRLKRAQQYGFNMAKSCVELFTPDFIEAADEAGIMVIQEFPFGVGPLRANRYTIGEPFRDYFSEELQGMVKENRNHPSVVAYSMSSELEFANQTQESFDFFSRDLCKQTKKAAPNALVIDCTGYLNKESCAKGRRITDFYASIIPTWCKEVLDETPVESDLKHPTILHEFNWWSCYPDPLDKPKYADTQMLASWFDTLVQTAKDNGQEDLIPTYRRIGLRLQALCRKDGLEYARRCPNVEGYILWSLIDFHQYAEGLLDDFWEPKNVSAKEMLKSTGDTVIVLAKEGNRCVTAGAHSSISLAISHYGEDDLAGSVLKWKLAKGPVTKSGEIRVPALKQGEVTQAGSVELDLPARETGYGFELEVALCHDGRVVNTNNWSFWAFPDVKADADVLMRTGAGAGAPIAAGTKLVVADSIDGGLVDYVSAGGKCLLFTKGSVIENTACYYQTTSFYPLFRCIPWNAGPGNSGTVIADHPALDGFPHDEMCDLQFIWMIRGTLPMEFGPLRKYGVTPIIRAIDWYRKNMNNAYMLEFKVGAGKVLVTSLDVLRQAQDVLSKTPDHIEARNLLQTLIRHARGSRFDPAATVPRDEFVRLFSLRENVKKTAGK